MHNPSIILQKHKLNNNKLNTITYVESTEEDFNCGTLKGVQFKENSLMRSERLDESCELYIDNSLPCIDKSPNPKQITVVTRHWHDQEEGNVLEFSSGHYIRLDEDISFGRFEDFTVEFRIKRITNNIAANRWIIGDANAAPYFRLCLSDTGDYLNGKLGDYTFGCHIISEHTPPKKWITLALERHKGLITVYVDGRAVCTCPNPSVQELKMKKNSTLMSWSVGDTNHFSNCYLKELSLHRKALYCGDDYYDRESYRISPEIIVPEDTKSITLNWEGLGKVSVLQEDTTDSDGLLILSNGELYLPSGIHVVTDTSATAPIKFRGYSKTHNFVRAKTYGIRINNPLQRYRMEGDFTLESTVMMRSLPPGNDNWPTNYGNNFMMFAIGTTSSSDGYQFLLSNKRVMFANHDKVIVDCEHNAKVGEVHHYAVCRKDGTIRLFIDGVCVVEKEYTQHLNRGEFAYVGCETMDGAYLDGYILDLRVFDRAKYDKNFVCEHKPYSPYSETKMIKGKPMLNVPHKFKLKEEVGSGERISNVVMDIKVPVDEVVVHPKENIHDNILYVYKSGDECVDVTGGFNTMVQFNSTTWTNQNLATKLPESIDVYALGLKTKNSIVTNKPIAFSRFTKMFIDVSVHSKSDVSGDIGVYVYNNIVEVSGYMPAGKVFAGTEGRVTIEVNISSLNSHYWIGAYAAANSEAKESHITVHNIWLQE